MVVLVDPSAVVVPVEARREGELEVVVSAVEVVEEE